jgi:hypothetical protein
MNNRGIRARLGLCKTGILIFSALGLTTGLAQLTQAQTRNTTWKMTGSMLDARRLHTATLLPNGKVLVAGGLNGSVGPYSATNTAEIYDPATGTWRFTGSLRFARWRHTATLLANGQVLVVGGFNDSRSTSLTVTDTAELYDPVTETWSTTGNLSGARSGHTTTILPSGKVLITGGFAEPFEILNTAEVYDPVTGLWTATDNLNTPRWLHTATLLPGGKVLVAAGSNGDFPFLSTAEMYDPATGLWNTTGNLNSRDFATATLLPNGKLLVAEGQNSESELYDPATEIWTSVGRVNVLREQGYTATLLPSGEVLLAGGYNYDFFIGTEIYDPATGIWNGSGRLNTGRYGHTATLLPNGLVLVAGGAQEANVTLLNSAELFDVAAANAISIQFDPVVVEAGTMFFAEFSGADVADQTWFDVRFQGPGDTTDKVALNWQRGSSALHSLNGIAAGLYTVTGIRTHMDEADHTGAFTSVHAPLEVLQP